MGASVPLQTIHGTCFFKSTAFEIWRAQKEMHSILMLHPFAEQKPNSETIASFLDFEVSFQLYVGRHD